MIDDISSTPTDIPFVVVSGLPASGKTTLSRGLAVALSLPLIDKDDILEVLFESLGVGNDDWRQRLSRASDEILERLARSSSGSVLTSFWRNPQISTHSGTPTDWITAASRCVIEVYCVCDPEVAAARFINRVRHRGHLDSGKQYEDVVSNFRSLTALGPLGIGGLLQVNTSGEVNLGEVVKNVKSRLQASKLGF